MQKNIVYVNSRNPVIIYKNRVWVQQSWLIAMLLDDVDKLLSANKYSYTMDREFLKSIKKFIIENQKYSNFQEEGVKKIKDRHANRLKTKN